MAASTMRRHLADEGANFWGYSKVLKVQAKALLDAGKNANDVADAPIFLISAAFPSLSTVV